MQKRALSVKTQTHMPRLSKEKKISSKAALLIDLHRNESALKWVCVEKGRTEKVCVKAVASKSPVPDTVGIKNLKEIKLSKYIIIK